MSFGGKFDYADEYAKYRPKDDAKFGSYVDKYPDLAAAWKKIEDDPSHADSQYWIKRGATSKAAFGRAHAAEDEALSGGTYQGGTDVKPYEGDTRFEKWLDTSGGNGTEPYVGGGGSPGDRNYPMSIVDYTPPAAMSGIPLEYQPWLQPDHIPDNLWNYQAPELTPWKGRGVDWSWAEKPVSEYGPQQEVKTNPAAAAAAAASSGSGDTSTTSYQGPGSKWYDYAGDPYGFEDRKAWAARNPSAAREGYRTSPLQQKAAYMDNPALTMDNLNRMQRDAELSRLNAMSGPTNYQQNAPGMDRYSTSPAMAGMIHDYPALAPTRFIPTISDAEILSGSAPPYGDTPQYATPRSVLDAQTELAGLIAMEGN